MKDNTIEFCKWLGDKGYFIHESDTYNVYANRDYDRVGTLEEVYDNWLLNEIEGL